MTEVSVCTKFTLGNTSYVLPEDILINPKDILDETLNVYRVSIGVFNANGSAEYQRFFAALDKQCPFIEDLHIYTKDAHLEIAFAYISKTVKPFGIFYDIEAECKDLKYESTASA